MSCIELQYDKVKPEAIEIQEGFLVKALEDGRSAPNLGRAKELIIFWC